ncbi:hypothetical protein N7452_003226 [Penicillium brevicompactum]|uniref:Uncharacterized protein n=1 Tax=Penicillium brevicompactum TaxID=5074 RepID=A0A9W9QZ27_PENBR|nr:hypothetical protein N7452_003226 [Penicillium brevicompactum]
MSINAGRRPRSAFPRVIPAPWAAFATHRPMHARVTVEQVKAGGFFQDLYKLPGARSTWWTGGACAANFQTQLWKFDEGLIPKIPKTLQGL